MALPATLEEARAQVADLRALLMDAPVRWEPCDEEGAVIVAEAPSRWAGWLKRRSAAIGDAEVKRVCTACSDTHTVHLEDRSVMCTRCPTPCEDCRSRPAGRPGPGGPYCQTTPCACACHLRAAYATRRDRCSLDGYECGKRIRTLTQERDAALAAQAGAEELLRREREVHRGALEARDEAHAKALRVVMVEVSNECNEHWQSELNVAEKRLRVNAVEQLTAAAAACATMRGALERIREYLVVGRGSVAELRAILDGVIPAALATDAGRGWMSQERVTEVRHMLGSALEMGDWPNLEKAVQQALALLPAVSAAEIQPPGGPVSEHGWCPACQLPCFVLHGECRGGGARAQSMPPMLEAMIGSRETQASINEWQRETFGTGAEPIATAVRVIEEATELSQAILRDARISEIAEECADIHIFLCYLAMTGAFDLREAIEKKMKKNRARVWRPSGAGHFQHVDGDAP